MGGLSDCSVRDLFSLFESRSDLAGRFEAADVSR